MIRLPFSKPTDSLSCVFRYLKIFNRLKNFRPFSGTQYLRWIASESKVNCRPLAWTQCSTMNYFWRERLTGKWIVLHFRGAVFSLNCNRRELLSSKWIVVHFRGRTSVRWIVSEGNVWKRSELSSIFGTHYLWVDLHSKRTTEPDVNCRPFSGTRYLRWITSEAPLTRSSDRLFSGMDFNEFVNFNFLFIFLHVSSA